MTTFTATERRSHLLSGVSHGGAYTIKNLTSTVEITTGATGRTVNFGYIPSNARLLGSSRLYWDDLSGAATTLDMGLAAVNGNLANSNDPDAIGNGFDLGTATTNEPMISEIANIGLPAWDMVASESSDPGGMLMVYGTVLDQTSSIEGTVTAEMYYVVD